MFQEYAQVAENSKMAEQYLDGVTSSISVPIFHFYDSLTQLALYPNLPQPEQEAVLIKVSANQQKMQKWADHVPMNFLYKFYLVEAESCRVLGKDGEAREYYDKAIELAQEHEYLNEEALAYELVGQFYLVKGQSKIAQVYLRNAHYAYQQWGSLAKVKDLETRYPQFLAPKAARAIPTNATILATKIDSASTKGSSEWLDLNSVVKASQTLSGEIVLGNLLEKMMHIVIENAGVQKGFLLLPNQDNWFIEAEGTIEQITVLQSISIQNISTNIVNYIIRTEEPVVLHNATQEGDFVRDPYVIEHRPKSILCIPLLNQGQLIGILYLENNLATEAFTVNRVETLNLLSSQIAISIENSLLYNNLEQKIIERTHELQTAKEVAETANKIITDGFTLLL